MSITTSITTAQPTIEIAGENALIIYLDDTCLVKTSSKIAQLKTLLSEKLADKLIEQIPSYNSLLVVFDLYKIDYFAIRKTIKEQLLLLASAHQTKCKTIELPVFYSEKSGPDLALCAKKANLSIDEVIHIHQAQSYQIFALGFAPGFAFLGEVDERIAMPRLATPRKKVPKGAVGIADQQTAVYPASSPGGWNLIGLCPTPLFDPDNAPHMPFSVGDRVKFKPITEQEFTALGGKL
ncbi:5-oxoprolinase subunit PxpB [Paraglaciecola aquimarina]|uniref:5-oxoprolinase subunit PxpB n=1 Tax=Paraglaciecola algarum TaxID=3050085 RepID=A0ABS9D541_9ALTE|nr:5-oxoprolinase subunit PxpB [Paraglaciecola sp. G1-23]MCF2947794.1 5-oxoprolinase subunit PxpB [Paraglaciecola sp. G1-23]